MKGIKEHTTLLQNLSSGFKRVVKWNKCQSKVATQAQSQYLEFLIFSDFQAVIKLFVLFFEDDNHKTWQIGYFLPTVEIKGQNTMIVGKISLINL